VGGTIEAIIARTLSSGLASPDHKPWSLARPGLSRCWAAKSSSGGLACPLSG